MRNLTGLLRGARLLGSRATRQSPRHSIPACLSQLSTTSHQRQQEKCTKREFIQETIKSVSHRKSNMKKAKLVIFDKDGTLICFHTMWTPWAKRLASNIANASGLDIEEKIFDTLGFCHKSNRVLPGLLAEKTTPEIVEELEKVLVGEGLSPERSMEVIKGSWLEGDAGNPDVLRTTTDLRTLFRILRGNGMKIAICTSDNRAGTINTLSQLGLNNYVDCVVCGDDPNMLPKPNPHNAWKICEAVGVDPSDTVMVGDTVADVGMGRNANLGWSVGVLSGVCGTEELLALSDHVVKNVKDLLPLILPYDKWKEYYAYSANDRILIEPHSLEEACRDVSDRMVDKKKMDLVIFDIHGTLLCTHSRHTEWLERLTERLEQITGMKLANKVFDVMGACQSSRKIQSGILAEGSMHEVKSAVVKLLTSEGFYYEEAILIMNQAWQDSEVILNTKPKSLDKDVKEVFKNLKLSGVKIAICTGSTRETSIRDLMGLDVLNYVDMMVCGDDPHSQPKPSAHNLKLICDELKVDPSAVCVVGDTVSDLHMGSSANVASKIGVLSGVGSHSELKPHADLLVDVVSEILPHVVSSGVSGVKGSGGSTGRRLFSTSANNSPFIQIRRNLSRVAALRLKASEDKPATYDYVIVGAGSAGCVLANRLSKDPENRVLLLEAGPKDDTWKIHMPAALMYNLCDDQYNWYYMTEPEKCMNNRVMYWPRGRVWGGSSSLNAMVYIRGHAYDYDRWEREGAAGWSYADCLPYFRRSQTHELGPDDYRGGDGPLHVSRGKTNNPLFQAFIDAGVQAGYPFTDDLNGFQQEGVGLMDMTIHKGKRWSAASAYLRPALYRDNLYTETGALTTKIVFDNNRAVGLEYKQGGVMKEVRADKEVILSGGAINSPQLLMMSGIGNADDLRKLDIPVVANLPGVGENLQDHLEVYVQQECTKKITLYSAQWKFPHNMIRIGLQWFTTNTGDGATAHLEAGGFIRTRPGIDHPDIQYHFLPSTVNDHGRKTGPCHAYQAHVGTLRPTSRGFIKLKSRDPAQHPRIVANYLSTHEDIVDMRNSVKLTREIFAQKAFDEFRGLEIAPGYNITSDKDIDELNRNMADSAYHPSCTCKMGSPSDPMAVVDPSAKVIGVDGLRVVDASIMPSVVSGNLNGPTIMISEKCADIILGQKPLPKSTAPVYRPKTLESQR
ncbi:uncharacterized protein LOC124113340 [Haliotis rufescens]|uniref:uncharacterized protein LOC124113340 n=1 Tax=Haliotis rufescens TaxID=6454 RepID=UPI00201F3C63|nr:uncharacterized protein LOC124113340 [Haliotis rufescens]XP_046329577.2 uncharacterized protein LOC124113340 [Haliotis rufescens]